MWSVSPQLLFDPSYLHRAMSNRFHSTMLNGTRLISSAVCAVTLLMMLTFPISQGHQLTSHFRVPDVCRSTERRTPIAPPEAETAERIAHQAALPALPIPIIINEVVEPTANIELPPQVPLSRLLLRLKIGSSRSSSQDPLL
jgi:hypothetical protein